ncbi:hypothetical protein CFD26_105806 [Aspergillus turcosus]|uniref:PBP domain-containing protein n=1 Tax=Aspergillus turcosus TaxID=1245748 RepID=A0A421D1N4_9EURO|nr:hypothetical protein CFD26_105806 [Aspergillus turcosus]
MRFSTTLSMALYLGLSAAAYDPVYFAGDELPTNKPQTAAAAAAGQAHGRPLVGSVEVLQPTLDPNLTDYVMVKTNLKGNYTFAASDVLAVLSQRWVSAFMKIYPNVNIQIPPPYAGSLGALQLINGSLQGVFVSRELKPSDVQGFQDAFGYPPTSVPISGGSYRLYGFLDSVGFIVNKINPIESLTYDQLDGILSTTHARGTKNLTKWGDVGVTGPLAAAPIKIYGIAPWNGFEEFVRERVLSYNGTRGEWRSGNKTAPNYDPLVTWDATVFNMSRHVAADPAGIAYTGMAYIDAPVKVIGVSESSAPSATVYSPTYENVALAKWPLSRVTYFNSNTDPKKGMDPVLKELQKFIISKQGQKILLDQGIYLPFRAHQQKSSLALLNQVEKE